MVSINHAPVRPIMCCITYFLVYCAPANETLTSCPAVGSFHFVLDVMLGTAFPQALPHPFHSLQELATWSRGAAGRLLCKAPDVFCDSPPCSLVTRGRPVDWPVDWPGRPQGGAEPEQWRTLPAPCKPTHPWATLRHFSGQTLRFGSSMLRHLAHSTDMSSVGHGVKSYRSCACLNKCARGTQSRKPKAHVSTCTLNDIMGNEPP